MRISTNGLHSLLSVDRDSSAVCLTLERRSLRANKQVSTKGRMSNMAGRSRTLKLRVRCDEMPDTAVWIVGGLGELKTAEVEK
jgi:hypothetical protein